MNHFKVEVTDLFGLLVSVIRTQISNFFSTKPNHSPDANFSIPKITEFPFRSCCLLIPKPIDLGSNEPGFECLP